MKKAKSKKWFVKVRGSYLPVSAAGWLSYVPYVAFLVASFISVNNGAGSISDTMIGIVPYWVSAAVIMQWFASRNS